MKQFKEVLLLTSIIVIVSIVSYLSGKKEANKANLSDFNKDIDSIITEAKQIGYDSAKFEIQQDNLLDIKKGLN